MKSGVRFVLCFASALLFSPVASAERGIRDVWPGWYLTSVTSGLQILYYFDANGEMEFAALSNGQVALSGTGRCRMGTTTFSCDYLDPQTGGVVTTNQFVPGRNFTSVRPTDGAEACLVTRTAGGQVLNGMTVRGCD